MKCASCGSDLEEYRELLKGKYEAKESVRLTNELLGIKPRRGPISSWREHRGQLSAIRRLQRQLKKALEEIPIEVIHWTGEGSMLAICGVREMVIDPVVTFTFAHVTCQTCISCMSTLDEAK